MKFLIEEVYNVPPGILKSTLDLKKKLSQCKTTFWPIVFIEKAANFHTYPVLTMHKLFNHEAY